MFASQCAAADTPQLTVPAQSGAIGGSTNVTHRLRRQPDALTSRNGMGSIALRGDCERVRSRPAACELQSTQGHGATLKLVTTKAALLT